MGQFNFGLDFMGICIGSIDFGHSGDLFELNALIS